MLLDQLNLNTFMDYLGSVITSDWKKIPSTNIVPVDPQTFPEVIRISRQVFQTTSESLFFRYSKIFNYIFYIAKKDSKVVGYCVYHIKPIISIKGIKKEAILYSIAIDNYYQNEGFGKKLLTISIQEMKINKISNIILFTNKKNFSANSLYLKCGFEIIKEMENICGIGEKCFMMSLKLL